MNILLVSHLTKSKSQGPNVSIPNQVLSQSNYDNIFWWNLTEAVQQHWIDTGLFHGIAENSELNIDKLPIPFNNPDLVVFQSFYYLDDYKLAKQLVRKKIPYIIVPRSALTKQGQKQKYFKKVVGNTLLFNWFTKKAAAIHYLTEEEYRDSGYKWNTRHFIMPNGINKKDNTKEWDSLGLNGVYIGRMDPYQKGLDLLLNASFQIKDELEKNHLKIHLYGPERLKCQQKFRVDIKKMGLGNILYVHDGVFNEDKENVLLDADFFIMTSRFEGHPMGLIEALSYGLPCLVTDGTNMAEKIKKVDAGWTATNSAESIVRALKLLIEDRSKFSTKGINALQLSKEYDWDSLAQRLHMVYKQLLRKEKNAV